MTRFRAFGIHLGLSLLIFLVVLYFILFHWYPFPFFSTDGGWKGIQILMFVDVVLGPLLTLIVYKQGKKHLRFDLTVIGLIQITALTTGVWLIYNERPAAAVFVEDGFSTLVQYQQHGLISQDELQKYGKRAPRIIYLDIPEGKIQSARIKSLQTGIPMAVLTEYYAPIKATSIAAIAGFAIDMERHVADKPEAKVVYDNFVRRHKTEMADIIFLEWQGRYKKGFVAANKVSLEFIEFVDIEPVPVEKKKVRM